MKRATRTAAVRWSLLGGLCLLLAPWLAAAQPAQPPSGAAAPSASRQADDAPRRAEPRGRLPMYYGSVVSPEQRRRIYEIQAQYAEQIAKLREQLEKLLAQRDAEVEGVLTPEQKAKVAELREAARARRAAARSNSSGAGGGGR